jgi:hypothetical protein
MVRRRTRQLRRPAQRCTVHHRLGRRDLRHHYRIATDQEVSDTYPMGRETRRRDWAPDVAIAASPGSDSDCLLGALWHDHPGRAARPLRAPSPPSRPTRSTRRPTPPCCPAPAACSTCKRTPSTSTTPAASGSRDRDLCPQTPTSTSWRVPTGSATVQCPSRAPATHLPRPARSAARFG